MFAAEVNRARRTVVCMWKTGVIAAAKIERPRMRPCGETQRGAVPAGGSDLSQLTKTQFGKEAFLPRLPSQAACQNALTRHQTLGWLADSESAKAGRARCPGRQFSAYGLDGRARAFLLCAPLGQLRDA